MLSGVTDKTDPKIAMSMERGLAFPLFQGSLSRVILARPPRGERM